jgi:hypothetical protein
MGVRRDFTRYFDQMQGHRLSIAARHDERGALAFARTDRAENVGRGGTLVLRRAGPRTPLGPAARELVLLADAGFVLKPNFYLGWIAAFFASDLLQEGGKLFLKFSIAPSACA